MTRDPYLSVRKSVSQLGWELGGASKRGLGEVDYFSFVIFLRFSNNAIAGRMLEN